MNPDNTTIETPLISRLEMEVAIERLFTSGISNQRLVIDLIDALTPADVSRQEVAFNVALVANEGLALPGSMPTKSLLIANDDACKSGQVSSDRHPSHPFLANAVRQLAAIACYFAAIYAVGVFILTREVGLTAAIPLAVKTCAGKSLVAALIGPWIQRITGVSPS